MKTRTLDSVSLIRPIPRHQQDRRSTPKNQLKYFQPRVPGMFCLKTQPHQEVTISLKLVKLHSLTFLSPTNRKVYCFIGLQSKRSQLLTVVSSH